MQHIIKALEDQFYTPAFRIVGLILVLIVSLKHRKKFIPLKYFPFYATTLLLDDVFFYWYHIAEEANYHGDFFWGLSSYLDYLFTFVELIFFSHFYYHLSYTQIIKKLILVFNVFFGLFFVYMAIKDKYFYEGVSGVTQSIVYTVESIILLFLCSFYFIDLFKKLPVVNLKNEPGFWVSTGLMFFMACTLPYSLLQNKIMKNYPYSFFSTSYSIFDVFYVLLFLMIIRAYLCKPVKAI